MIKPLTDDTKDTSELRSNLVSYFDKVISINDELEPLDLLDPDTETFTDYVSMAKTIWILSYMMRQRLP